MNNNHCLTNPSKTLNRTEDVLPSFAYNTILVRSNIPYAMPLENNKYALFPSIQEDGDWATKINKSNICCKIHSQNSQQCSLLTQFHSSC